MNQTIELPSADPKYLELVEGELVTLVKAIDDKDCARIYKVKEVNGSKLTVEVVAETPINKTNSPTKETMVGRVFFNMDKHYFQSYL